MLPKKWEEGGGTPKMGRRGTPIVRALAGLPVQVPGQSLPVPKNASPGVIPPKVRPKSHAQGCTTPGKKAVPRVVPPPAPEPSSLAEQPSSQRAAKPSERSDQHLWPSLLPQHRHSTPRPVAPPQQLTHAQIVLPAQAPSGSAAASTGPRPPGPLPRPPMPPRPRAIPFKLGRARGEAVIVSSAGRG